MLTSLTPSPAWDLPHKQRLSTFLSQAPVVCRIAPSPTGQMHLGTARTALHNFLAARASGGKFLLRIDDTDAARNDPAHVDLIHRTLDRLGLHHDGVFHQSSRRDAHRAAAQALLDSGWAVHDQGAVRLAPHARSLAPDRFFDLGSGVCQVSATLIDHADSLVLLRSDGSPTYHFSSVVDDIDHGVSLILRGMDHLSNVAKQVIVARALAQAGWPGAADFCRNVMFAHVGLLMQNGKKLSKRDAAASLDTYFDQSVSVPALLQWLMMLGWGAADPQFDRAHPRIALDVMPGLFAQGGLRSSNAFINPDRLVSLRKTWRRSA